MKQFKAYLGRDSLLVTCINDAFGPSSVAQPNGDINPCTGDQDCKHVCPAPASGAQRALEHDRTKVAECLTAVKSELHSYDWLITSRGSYEWNDDRWHDEFKRASESIWKAIEPMVKIAADWSNCPTNWEEVQAARLAAPAGHALSEEQVRYCYENASLSDGEENRFKRMTDRLNALLASQAGSKVSEP